MKLTIFQVPYDSGHHAERMGRGPLHLVDGGLARRLRDGGHDVELTSIVLDGFLTEVGSAVAIQRRLALAVADARRAGRLPVVLSGNCNTAVGTLAGVGTATTGVVWFDAHGDFNTPETSPTGFFDGMALAVACGHCWRVATATVPGFAPLPERNVLMVGVRDLDPLEEKRLAASDVARLAAADLRRDGMEPVESWRLSARVAGIERLYLHVDLDVLDPSQVRANPYAAAGGLTVDELLGVAATVLKELDVAAVAITSYDPACDREDRVPEVTARLIESL
ncbi:MAG TPA: arginase family protein [Thermoanaerobaculia bacterium]